MAHFRKGFLFLSFILSLSHTGSTTGSESFLALEETRLSGRYAWTSQSIHREDHASRWGWLSRFEGGHVLHLSYENEWRRYEPATTFQDHRFQIEPVMRLHPHVYVETLGAFTVKPDFWSRWMVGLSPHFLWNDFDWGVGFRFQDYATTNTWLVLSTLGWEKSGHRLIFRFDGLVSPEIAVSGGLSYRMLFERFEIELRGGGGEADEGEGIIDRFHRYGAELQWKISPQWALSLENDDYLGRRRQEYKWGTGLQWIF